MRIAQLADFHFTRLTANPFRLFSKRILAHLNWIFFRRKNFFENQLDSLPLLLKELNVDLVLLGGDFTTTALPTEFKRAAQFVSQLPASWIAIPGNHDCYTFRSDRQKHFYRYFTNHRKQITHRVEFFNLKEHGVEAHRVDSDTWIVALDTAQATNPYSSEGFFSPQLERNLKEVLGLIDGQDRILLLNHYPFFQNDEPRRNLKRGEVLQHMLEKDPRISVYLHGHTHRHTVADLQVSDLPLILDSGSCTHHKKGSWNLIDLTADGCKVSTYRWTDQWTSIRTESFEWTRH